MGQAEFIRRGDMTKLLLTRILGVLVLCACALGDEIDNANKYIDELLDNLRKDPVIAKKIEPIHVPNIKRRHFEGTNIYIKGLSSLQRNDRCKVSVKEGNEVVIDANLKATDIRFYLNYRAKADIVPFSIYGKAEGKVDKVSIRAIVSVSPSDSIGKLKEFKVTRFGKFRVTKARGATFLLNWLVRIITNDMLHHARGMIIDRIEKGVSSLLQEKLSEVKISARRLNP